MCWHRDPLYPCFSHPANLLNSLNSALPRCRPGLLDLFSETCVIVFVSTLVPSSVLCSSNFLRMGCLLFCRLYKFQRMTMPWYRMTLSFSSYIWKSEIKCLNSLFDGLSKKVYSSLFIEEPTTHEHLSSHIYTDGKSPAHIPHSVLQIRAVLNY